jgi:hypothetical protein
VRIRLTYTADRSRLSRLEEAVEKDPRMPPERKSEVMDHLRKLTALLLEQDRSMPPEMPAGLAPKRRKEA